MTPIEQFFKDHLHNKNAYIFSDGLQIEGNLDQKCRLEYIPHFGLGISIRLEYNRKDISEHIRQILKDERENLGLSYDIRNNILDILIPTIKSTYVSVGIISCIGVKNINTEFYDNGELSKAEIVFKNGSKTTIRGIEAI